MMSDLEILKHTPQKYLLAYLKIDVKSTVSCNLNLGLIRSVFSYLIDSVEESQQNTLLQFSNGWSHASQRLKRIPKYILYFENPGLLIFTSHSLSIK